MYGLVMSPPPFTCWGDDVHIEKFSGKSKSAKRKEKGAHVVMMRWDGRCSTYPCWSDLLQRHIQLPLKWLELFATQRSKIFPKKISGVFNIEKKKYNKCIIEKKRVKFNRVGQHLVLLCAGKAMTFGSCIRPRNVLWASDIPAGYSVPAVTCSFKNHLLHRQIFLIGHN